MGRAEETVDSAQSRRFESRYDVVLLSAGPKERRVVRIIAEFTYRTRQQALELVQTAPVLILQGAGYATAEGARLALERLGATIEVRASDVETPWTPDPSTPMGAGQIALVILFVGILILFILIILATIIVANLGDPTF
jgi:ABC-type Na+ efflux pump permease subunit